MSGRWPSTWAFLAEGRRRRHAQKWCCVIPCQCQVPIHSNTGCWLACCCTEYPSAVHPRPTVGLRSGSSSREGPLTNSTASNGHLQTPSTLNDLILQPGGSKKPLTGSFSSNGGCQIVISGDHFTLDRPCTYCTAVVCPPQSRFNKKGRFRRW